MNMATAVNMPKRLRVVLGHLARRPSITPLEALGLYGEQRLADCIHELKKRGYRISTETRHDLNGRKYGHYKFIPAGAAVKELEPA